MDVNELRTALKQHFTGSGLQEKKIPDLKLDTVFEREGELWGCELCPDKDTTMAYFGTFEAAIQNLVDARRANSDLNLGLAVAFASTTNGERHSYRKPLRKYSNSIVFEDLALHLLLVTSKEEINVLVPKEVNSFLRDLNRWIAARK
ncbi:MAG: hypothetical protein ACRDFQ_02300 [Anaerolineales bacterium]